MRSLLLPILLAVAPGQAVDTPVDALPEGLREDYLDAEEAWQSGRLEDAAKGFLALTEAAPDFDRAWRRACGVRVQQGRHRKAIRLCREAVSRSPSLENRTGLAIALIHGAGESEEARTLVDEVTAEDPTWVIGWQALCSYALEHEDADRLRRCVDGLTTHTPTAAAVPVFRALLAAEEGRFEDAWQDLENAAGAGVGEAMLAGMRARVASLQTAAPAATASRTRGWSASDLAPVGIVVLLITGIAVLALSDEEEDEDGSDA